MNHNGSKKRRQVVICVVIICMIAVIACVAIARGKNQIHDMSGSASQQENTNTTDTQDESTAEKESTGEKKTSAESETGGDIRVQKRTEAPYEHWLIATALTGISMEYTNFGSEEFYAATETSLGESGTKGIYITFTVDGEKKCIYVSPIQAERTEHGTRDIYSEIVGFATFDEVDPDKIPDAFSAISIDNMNDLITQSTQILVYSH